MNVEKMILSAVGLTVLILIPLGAITNSKIEPYRRQAQQLEAQVKDAQDKVNARDVEIEQLKKDLQAKLDKEKTEQLAIASKPLSTQCEAYRPLVAQYGWDIDIAMAVMQAESGCNPNATNTTDNHGACMGSFGLFQISCQSGQVYDPTENVAIAWAKYQARGWQPWGAYTNGSYLKYL